MSLKGFHVVFVSASALVAFFFAFWCVAAVRDPGAGRVAAAVVSALAGVGLLAYEAWFLRKMRRLEGRS
jgi:hypothetical protein